MKKKVLFTALLSTVLLVGCGSYSKVDAAKAKEVQEANLAKEISYKKAVTSTIVSKLDVKIQSDALTTEMKDAAVAMFKATFLTGMGVEEVGKKVENEVTDANLINAYRVSATMFAEAEGTTYYTSGSKIKVVATGKQDGLDAKQTTLINEYGYQTSVEISLTGDINESGMKASISLNAKSTINYTK